MNHRWIWLGFFGACAVADGTVGGTGFSSTPGASTQTATNGSTSITASTGTTTLVAFELVVNSVRVADSLGVRSNLPMFDTDCLALVQTGAPCGDVDADGLTDAWEDAVLGRLTPAIRFDEAEPLVSDPMAVLVNVGRVAPADDGSGGLRAFIMVGYHTDYGRCGLSGHDGDSERVALDLAVVGPGDVDVLGFYTAAHEGTITDHGHVFRDGELAELVFPTDPVLMQPRWMVFSSDGKHATYGSVQRCEDAEWLVCLEEDCEADGVDPLQYTWVPEVFNAGEESAPRLTDLGAIGFPGEDAWLDQDFCGGGDGGVWGVCASSVREKLLDDPF
jgi:hypothetical protein